MIARIRRWLWRLRSLIVIAPASLRLAIACLLVFTAQQVASRVDFAYGYTFSHAWLLSFGLNGSLLARGFFWQPVTYLFLHANGLHLAFNVLAVLLFGSGLEGEVGARRFTRIFLADGMLNGLS